MRFRSLLAIAAWLAGAVLARPAHAQSVAPEIKRVNPPGLGTPRGYTHVVTATGGKTIWIAGQVSQDAKGEVVGKGDLKAQTLQVFANLKTALGAAGASFQDVVKMNTYVVGLTPEALQAIRDVRAEVLRDVPPPASTLVGVTALARPDYLIEIEVVAVVR